MIMYCEKSNHIPYSQQMWENTDQNTDSFQKNVGCELQQFFLSKSENCKSQLKVKKGMLLTAINWYERI